MRRTILKGSSSASELEKQRYTDATADFIRIEQELADTFCSLALEPRTGGQQHLFNARRALDGAFHALAKVQMDEKELDSIIPKLEEVKALVESLEQGRRTLPNC
jgi:DNA-binding FadR family transcriptional regulator